MSERIFFLLLKMTYVSEVGDTRSRRSSMRVERSMRRRSCLSVSSRPGGPGAGLLFGQEGGCHEEGGQVDRQAEAQGAVLQGGGPEGLSQKVADQRESA